VLTLDCLLTTHPTVAEAWGNRVQVSFEDGTAWVVSAVDLIALKRLRSSPMDLVDTQTLEALNRDASLQDAEGARFPGSNDPQREVPEGSDDALS
jgi:hypothetical protein